MPVVSGIGLTIGEDLFKSHSWTTGVVFLIIVHLPTGSVPVTREPEVVRQPSGMNLRSMRLEIINHVREKTWSLSWYSGDQLWQLMENAQYCRDTLVQFLRRTAIMSENQTRCSSDDRVESEFFCSVAMTACTNPSCGITIASTRRPSTRSGPESVAT